MTLILYEYTGSYDTFTVPSGVTEILVSLRGAAGGDSWPDDLDAVGHGGDGATVNGIEIPVTPGEVLRIYSGGLGATAWAAIGAALIALVGTVIATRGSTRGHQADLAAQLAEVVMREQREWSDDLRESEQACRDQLDQMRVELERMRGDLASTRRELEDTRRELEETRREVHGLRAQLPGQVSPQGRIV